MTKKGTYEHPGTVLAIIGIILVFLVTVFILVVFIMSFTVIDELHEMDRKADDLSENLLKYCDLLAFPGIFDAEKLDAAQLENPLKERCFRYCDIGSLIRIDDMISSNTWILGYRGKEYTMSEMRDMAGAGSFEVGLRKKSDTICEPLQECTFSSKDECESNCCSWTSAPSVCKKCDEIYSKAECEYIETNTGVCIWNEGSSMCEYTGQSYEIHRARIFIVVFDDIGSRISCAIDRAKETGKSQEIFIPESTIPSISGIERKIIIKGFSEGVSVEVPIILGSEESSPYIKDVTYERMLYSGSTGTTTINIMGNTLVTVSPSGAITYECTSCEEE